MTKLFNFEFGRIGFKHPKLYDIDAFVNNVLIKK